MASSTKKNSRSSKNRNSNVDLDKQDNTTLALSEEKRLLDSYRRSEKTSSVPQVSEKRLCKFYTFVNELTSDELDKELTKRYLSTSGELEIRRHRLKHHYKSESLFECGSPSTMFEQYYEYIAVIDFEATCEDQPGNKYSNEIIEFPIVLIDMRRKAIVDQFRSYCRPKINPTLTSFCTELTGIEQHQVDIAPTFDEVLSNVETWLKERNLLSSSNNRRLAFATDGPWDFTNFLQMQCQFSSIPYPEWATKWIDLRKQFARFYSVRRSGIEKMLEKLGLNFDGRRHSGLDDSINIARIALELVKDGCVLVCNDRIHPSDPKSTTMSTEETDHHGDDEELVVYEE